MSTTAAEPTLAMNTRVDRFALSEARTLAGLLIIGLFVCGAMAEWQDDSFWHLRCGQAIWRLGHVPTTDIFSYALPQGTFWPNHEWLAQVMLYGLYLLGGMPLASLSVGAVLALCGAALIKSMRGPMERRFLLLMASLPWIVAALSVRPQVLTLLAMSVQLMLLARGLHFGLVPLFLVWANVHGGVVLGGLLMVGWCVGTLLFERRRFLDMLIVTGMCGAATLLTPMGWRILAFPIESVHRLGTLGLEEWMPPGFVLWQHWYFWGLLVAFVVLLTLRARHVDAPLPRKLLLVAGLFAGMALMSARNIPNFLILAAVTASHLLPSRATDEKHTASRKNAAVVCTFAVVACVAIAVAYRAGWQRLNWSPMSQPAITAVRDCPRPAYNTYNTGGYLLWFVPQRAVFCDSRQDPYPLDLLQATITAQRSGEYEALFERYGFRSAIMEPHWPLAERLRHDGWRETYRDANWLVLVR